MTKPHDPAAAPSSTATHRGGKWLYLLLLTAQTAGALLLCWEVIPIYRKALADPTAYDSTTVLALGAGALIQLAYWIRYRIRPAPPRFVNVALGHTVLFASRLIFTLPTAVFSFLFLTESLEAQVPVLRYVVILFGLFSLFCYVRELERLGICLLGKPEE